MPFARNGYIRLYYETQGQGPPLLLCHGFCASDKRSPQKRYVDILQQHYRVIIMDQRGTGMSDKPHRMSAFRPNAYVNDILTILNKLDLRSTHYWGYADGSWRGWFCAERAPHRFRSMVLGGMGPWMAHTPGQRPPLQDMLETMHMQDLVKDYRDSFGHDWFTRINTMIRQEDIQAITASLGMLDAPHPEEYLPRLTVPLLGYAGSRDIRHDLVKRGCEMAPLGQFVSLDDLDFGSAYFRRERILPQALGFLRRAEGGLELAASA